MGGPGDNGGAGAAWVFTRSDGVWTQQGSKLIGTGAVGSGNGYSVAQGHSVALSADGNTAIVGGPGDNPGSRGNSVGAAWVFTRSDGVWTQQGSKLTGNDAVNGATGAQQGFAVALSADGNTAMVGGHGDNAGIGAAWVYTRSNDFWAQQGGKLIGNDAVGAANQGSSVALSADGNTAIVGGWADGWLGNVPGTGAVWVYTRTGNVWAQQGSKLVGTGAVNGTVGARLGYSVALSADGSTAIVGGYGDNDWVGAVWVFSNLPIFQVCAIPWRRFRRSDGWSVYAFAIPVSVERSSRQRRLHNLGAPDLAKRVLHLGNANAATSNSHFHTGGERKKPRRRHLHRRHNFQKCDQWAG